MYGTVGDLLGYLASSQPVYDRPQSHMHEQAQLLEVLGEALAKVQPGSGETFLKRAIDLGRVVGKTILVATTDQDVIVFARRVGRQGYSRFVKNRPPEDTRFLTVILKKDEHEEYWILISAYFGGQSEREPWDRAIRSPGERDQVKNFWSTHALVWGVEEVIPGTETTQNPWI